MTKQYSKAHLRSPFWLKGNEIEVIEQEIHCHSRVRTLDDSQQRKVAALLYGIAYAEKWALRRSTWISRCLQNIAIWMPKKLVNFPVPQQQLSHRKVRKILSHETNGLPEVIDHLVHQVGMEKSAPAILAEYHLSHHQEPRQENGEAFPKKGFRFAVRPSQTLDPSAYVEDGLEAYRYVLKD